MMSLWIDATEYVRAQRVTGVQRVVQAVLETGQQETVIPLKFSRKLGGFERLQSGSQSSQRFGEIARRATRWLPAIERLWYRLPAQIRAGRLSVLLNPVARQIFSILTRSPSSIRKYVSTGEIVKPDMLCLLDVPRDSHHLNFLKGLVREGMTLCVYLHDVIPTRTEDLWSSDLHEDQKNRFIEYLELVKHADTVICNSKFTRSEYFGLTGPETAFSQASSVLYPPLELLPRQSALRSGGVIQRGPLVQPAGFSIMAVAPLLRRKNLRVLLAAILRLASREKGTLTFVLVCPTSFQVDDRALELLHQINRLDSVNFLLKRNLTDEEILDWYQSVDVVAVPSLYEGFGLPILEGIAAGARVVASDIAVFRELRDYLDFDLVDAHSVQLWCESISNAASKEKPLAPPGDTFLNPTEFANQIRQRLNDSKDRA